MSEEKRMIESYEVKTAVHINRQEIILAEDKVNENPYMCCICTWDNPFNADIFSNAVVSDDYLEIMGEFTKRIDEQISHIAEQRKERCVTNVPLTAADCIENSRHQHYEGQIIVIDPAKMTPAARTADHQLCLATGGNGCNPEARGNAVFVTNLYSGEKTRWERYDVAGIIRPDRMPEWAKEKLEALGVKPSLHTQLEAGKQKIAAELPKGDAVPGKGQPEI
jgi:hypothetical protein